MQGVKGWIQPGREDSHKRTNMDKSRKTLQSLKAMRDDPAATPQERETAGRILRERLRKDCLTEDMINVEQPRAVPFITPTDKVCQQLFLGIACWIKQENPLHLEACRSAGRGSEEWTLMVTISQEMDIMDAYRHYLPILQCEIESIEIRRKDVHANARRQIKQIEEAKARCIDRLAQEKSVLVGAMMNRYGMETPEGRKKGRELNAEENAAALAAMNRLPDDEWRRKLKGEGPRALGNGAEEPFTLEG